MNKFLFSNLIIGLVAAVSLKAQQSISPYDFPYGYPFNDYPVNGASHPSLSNDYLDHEPDPHHELKRIGQYALRLIQTDSARKAIQYSDIYRENYPHLLDGEMLFIRTIAQAQLGWIDEAVTSMQMALDQTELPPQRFIAGPRRLLQPIQNHETYKQFLSQWSDKLVHGPMLGDMTENSVKIWVRTVSEIPVRVAVSREPDMANAVLSDAVLSRSENDYTAEVWIRDLEPDTKYYYDLLLDGKHTIRTDHQTFKTFSKRGHPSSFQMVFGGCAGFVPHNERMWDTIRKFEPKAFLTLGDNVYIDDPENPDQARYMYYQRQSRPEFRRLASSSPVYSIWDDHDFGMDDSWGGTEVDIPYWKPMVWEIFNQNWVNPNYKSGNIPGGWYDFYIGDVHFIMLDTRYYRQDAGRFGGKGVENPSMLGPEQKAWLKETLTNSTSTFKVVVSSVPWHYDAKGDGDNKVDGWLGYSGERDAIFSWIDDSRLDGVLLLSSDRHRSDAWLINRENGYDFYEFSSGHFTNQHTHSTLEGSLAGYNDKPSFGLLNFDTKATDPTVTYRIVDIDGFVQDTLTVKHSQLQY
ncbi:MAG: alkaline phosphatase [Bacteroidetes bacterium]|nr:alkaline phosphatase [Bacteroidota bacterium]